MSQKSDGVAGPKEAGIGEKASGARIKEILSKLRKNINEKSENGLSGARAEAAASLDKGISGALNGFERDERKKLLKLQDAKELLKQHLGEHVEGKVEMLFNETEEAERDGAVTRQEAAHLEKLTDKAADEMIEEEMSENNDN